MRVTSDALRTSPLWWRGSTTGLWAHLGFAAFQFTRRPYPAPALVTFFVEPTPKPPGPLDGQAEPLVPTPHVAVNPAGRQFRAGSRPFVIDKRSTSVRPTPHAQADPAATRADLAAACSNASAGHADAARHDSDSDHSGPDDAASPAGRGLSRPRPRRHPVVTQPPAQPPTPTRGDDGDDARRPRQWAPWQRRERRQRQRR